MPEAALPFSRDMFKPMLILVEYRERKALHPLEISNFKIVGSLDYIAFCKSSIVNLIYYLTSYPHKQVTMLVDVIVRLVPDSLVLLLFGLLAVAKCDMVLAVQICVSLAGLQEFLSTFSCISETPKHG
jgi:hypothetical protein